MTAIARRRLLSWLTCTALAAMLLPTGARAGETGPLEPGDIMAIRSVIEQQIAAFARDDGVAAFSYASPNIRALFGSPEAFMSMVKAGYQAVYRAQQLTFKRTRARHGQIVQGLVVVGPDGLPVLAVYFMERQPLGDWRIDGVQMLALPGRTT